MRGERVKDLVCNRRHFPPVMWREMQTEDRMWFPTEEAESNELSLG